MDTIFSKIAVTSLVLALPLSAHAYDQWASSVVNFSTQYSTTSWSAKQALKAPDTTNYGDYNTAWTTSSANAGAEYITLGYTTPVYATGVTVRETWGSGFVTGIDLVDTNNVTHSIWSGTDTSVAGQINDFKITWPRTSYLVKSVKVKINTALNTGWEEIDAVQLHGVTPFSGTLAPRLTHTATLVCKNLTTGITKTATITGTGTTSPVAQWSCDAAGLVINKGDNVSVQITGVINQ